MEYSIVVDFLKKTTKTLKKNKNKLCFDEKAAADLGEVRCAHRQAPNAGQWFLFSRTLEQFKSIALNWKTLEALGCDRPLSLPISAC